MSRYQILGLCGGFFMTTISICSSFLGQPFQFHCAYFDSYLSLALALHTIHPALKFNLHWHFLSCCSCHVNLFCKICFSYIVPSMFCSTFFVILLLVHMLFSLVQVRIGVTTFAIICTYFVLLCIVFYNCL